MSKSPGLYIDIGKMASYLLYQGYGQQPPNHFRNECLSSSFDIYCRCDDVVPGLSPAFRSMDHDSVSVELRYMRDYAGITAGIGLKAHRLSAHGLSAHGLSAHGSFAHGLFAHGLPAHEFSAYGSSAHGLSAHGLPANEFSAHGSSAHGLSAHGSEKLEILRASCYLELISLTRTAIAAELKHSFSKNGSISDAIPTTLIVGIQHELFPSTLVKARINTDGKELLLSRNLSGKECR
ncbi:mitochondrial outer membrane protein porin of 36 kDa-like [Citrus clementina]|uniref:mitochondrial outer membrane protein porin of 36 kDa-like n=1 Tax=Citrus clementina TaxID=85681 RepID=UPI000CED2BE7|nr:mitochondrial outer membrane protein porin of 36 kDa-like [Citrus x clementina]